MKQTLAITLLLASVAAYDVAEGPTKADNGEADPGVIGREHDIANGQKASGWTNPLGWADNGADDDSVLVQLQRNKKDAYDHDPDTVSQYDDMHQYKKFDWGIGKEEYAGVHLNRNAYGVLHGALAQQETEHHASSVSQYDDQTHYKQGDFGVEEDTQKEELLQTELEEQSTVQFLLKQYRSGKKADAYDHDPETVSQYDDMHQYKKFDWGIGKEEYAGVHLNRNAYGVLHGALAQRNKEDAYDHDPETVSQYDDMHQYKKFDWGIGKEEYAGVHLNRNAYGVLHGALAQRNNNKKDAYDHDPDTVSQYDDMHQYKKFDWGIGKEEYAGVHLNRNAYGVLHGA